MPSTALTSTPPSSSVKSSYPPSCPASNANDRLLDACRRPLDHIAHDPLNPCQTVHKLPEAVSFDIIPHIPQRDPVAHQLSYHRSAELCSHFLIFPLPWL